MYVRESLKLLCGYYKVLTPRVPIVSCLSCFSIFFFFFFFFFTSPGPEGIWRGGKLGTLRLINLTEKQKLRYAG